MEVAHSLSTYTEIIHRLKQAEDPPFRPNVPEDLVRGEKRKEEVPDQVFRMMQACWAEFPGERPLFPVIKATVSALNKGRSVWS